MFLNYWLFQWITAAITSHLRQVPALGSWGLEPWSKAFQQLPLDISFLQFCGCISIQKIPVPVLPNQLFVFHEEIFNGGNFYQICFPSAFFTRSCGWSIPSTLFSSLAPTSLRKFHGITIPLAPHCNKTLISRGTGSLCNHWISTSASTEQTQSSFVCLYLD